MVSWVMNGLKNLGVVWVRRTEPLRVPLRPRAHTVPRFGRPNDRCETGTAGAIHFVSRTRPVLGYLRALTADGHDQSERSADAELTVQPKIGCIQGQTLRLGVGFIIERILQNFRF